MTSITHQYILTPAELKTITGRVRASAQCRWLDEHHWCYVASSTGEIIVARSHMEHQLNPITHQITHNAGQDAPDWSTL